ncbi:caspase domain-containing protein [Mycena galericulata]|nr:caspase domain-containing protein [Mycena galericulata]
MMWDLGGGGGGHRSHTPSVPVAIPTPHRSSLSVPHAHGHARPSSVPPAPGWSAPTAHSHSHSRSRSHTPMPMPTPVSSSSSSPFLTPVARALTPQPQSRGLFHPSKPKHHHHHHHHHSAPQIQVVHSQPPPHHHHHAQQQVVVHGTHYQPQQVIYGHHQQQQHQLQPQMPMPMPMPAPHPNFMYSRCTGRRRALCIGINYRGQSHELKGCINDAKHVFNFLVRHAHYHPEDIVVLTDDSPHARGQPTRANMLDAMRWLVQGAQPHDALFFHYSGHGGQTPDKNGDEIDGQDEVIYPVDYKRAGSIVDDDMHDIMVHPLPAGCRLTAIFDSCHSGTVLDLPYAYDHHGRSKGPQVTRKWFKAKSTPADVITLSGCKDGQTSADTFADGEAVGAASHAFIKAVEMRPDQTYKEIMHNIRVILQPKFSQKPQLGSSHPINTNRKFIM